MTEEDTLDFRRADVLMGSYGEFSDLPNHDGGYTREEYAPSWLTEVNHDDCTTKLVTCMTRSPEEFAPPGMELVSSWACGERECPDCGPGTGNEEYRLHCKLCEGDGLIYWGDEWCVAVYRRLD